MRWQGRRESDNVEDDAVIGSPMGGRLPSTQRQAASYC
jgi:predicted metalloprotease